MDGMRDTESCEEVAKHMVGPLATAGFTEPVHRSRRVLEGVSSSTDQRGGDLRPHSLLETKSEHRGDGKGDVEGGTRGDMDVRGDGSEEFPEIFGFLSPSSPAPPEIWSAGESSSDTGDTDLHVLIAACEVRRKVQVVLRLCIAVCWCLR